VLTAGQRVITWAELDARSSRVARALLATGLRAQDRIAFLDRNGPEYFEVLFGAAKINVVSVAVNWRLAPGEMAAIVDDARARLLFVGPDFLGHLARMESPLQTVETVVVLGPRAGHPGYAAWLAPHAADDPGGEAAPTDVAMQLYTSGTTGLPRGAMLTNANLGTLIPHVGRWWQVDETTVSLVCMQLFHIGGSGWALVGMAHGCHSILFREFAPEPVLAALARHRVTNALFVPAMLQVLAGVPGADGGEYGALRTIVYGASPITNEVLLRAMKTFRCGFIQVYGLTETTGAITQLPAEDHATGGPRARLLRSAGRPFPWVELHTVDPGPDRECRAGEVGYLDDEGCLFLTDRVKDMIVSGGENVYPAEVENVLSDHPDVADVAVIGVPDVGRLRRGAAPQSLRQAARARAARALLGGPGAARETRPWGTRRLPPHPRGRGPRRPLVRPEGSGPARPRRGTGWPGPARPTP
jgi:long-chain acyl-CoA synthetase